MHARMTVSVLATATVVMTTACTALSYDFKTDTAVATEMARWAAERQERQEREERNERAEREERERNARRPTQTPIQERFADATDPVLRQCYSRCSSRLVGTFRCRDEEYVQCIKDVAVEHVHERMADLNGRERMACTAQSSSTYQFLAIQEFFPIDACIAAVDARVSSWAKIEADSKARDARATAEETAARTRAELARKQYIDDLRAGRRLPKTFSEQLLRDRIADGREIAASPRVKPDGQRYGLEVILEIPESNHSFAARVPSALGSPYVFAKLPEHLREKYASFARVGMNLNLVGRYSANRQVRATDGRLLTVPVFEVEHISIGQ